MAIFRKLVNKDPNGKKTACVFKKKSTINTSTLKFPSIRELELMLEERGDIKLTYSTSRYEKANMLSIHSFYTKALNTKTYKLGPKGAATLRVAWKKAGKDAPKLLWDP